jgi:hypothetical protein
MYRSISGSYFSRYVAFTELMGLKYTGDIGMTTKEIAFATALKINANSLFKIFN